MSIMTYILKIIYEFENIRKMCFKIYHLDPTKFLLASVLTWEAALKKTKVQLKLLTHIDMLLMN